MFLSFICALTVGVSGEQDVSYISASKQKYVGLLLWREILRQADCRRVANGIKVC
jgi:hypothetical protein